jgi:hypothetical protein
MRRAGCREVCGAGVFTLARVVEDDTSDVAHTRAHLAETMTQTHAVVSPPTPHWPGWRRKGHRIALAKRDDLVAAAP